MTDIPEHIMAEAAALVTLARAMERRVRNMMLGGIIAGAAYIVARAMGWV